jgi:hypothetical protein
MKLLIPKRIKQDLVQFTVTMDRQDRDSLMKLAEKEMLKFHRFTKAVLLGYLNYSSQKNKGR